MSMSFALFIYHIMHIMSFSARVGTERYERESAYAAFRKAVRTAKLAVDLQPAIACQVSRIVLW